jgi:hypothetical protein
MVGVALLEPAVERRDLALEVVDQLDRCGHVAAPGLGDVEPLQQPAALDPEQVGDRKGPTEVDHGRADPVLERRLVLDQVHPKAGQLALLAHPRIGQPDRRHQIALREHRQDQRVDRVGLAGQRCEALDPSGRRRSRPTSLPARACRGRVGRRSSTRRPRRRAGREPRRFAAPGFGASRRQGGRRAVDMLASLGEQADVELARTEIRSRVQHLKPGLLGAPRLVTTTEPVTNGGPPSWQSMATAPRVRAPPPLLPQRDSAVAQLLSIAAHR